jgi:EmrB/QacA subfamily drug resistance transporter
VTGSDGAAQAAVDAQPTRRPDRWVVLAALCLAQLVVMIDNTVLNVAIPSLNRDLGASTADVQWMVNAYSLVQSGLLLAAGSAADRYGRRRALILGLGLFGLGSAASAFSRTPAELIASRAGLGIGGALLMTTTLALIMQVFDNAERPRAIGIWGAVSSVGFAGGPVLGGLLLSHFWWGSVFLINVPIAVISAIVAARLIPGTRNPASNPPDLVGAALSIVGLVGIVYAIIGGPADGWLSAQVLVAAVVGIVAMVAFVWWERRAAHPMLDMSLFANAQFDGAIAGGVLVAFGMAGSLFLLTQHLQLVLGYTPLQAGLATVPLAATIVVLNTWGLSAKALRRFGTVPTIATGMTALAVGLTLVALLGHPGAGYGPIVVALVVMGVGLALSMPAMATAIMGGIPVDKAGVGAGVQGAVTEFGGGFGVAVLGAVLGARFVAALPAGVNAGAARSLPDAIAAAPGQADGIRHAFAIGVQTSQLVAAAIVFAGGMLAAILLRRAMRRSTAAAPAAATPVDAVP